METKTTTLTAERDPLLTISQKLKYRIGDARFSAEQAERAAEKDEYKRTYYILCALEEQEADIHVKLKKALNAVRGYLEDEP